MGWVTKKNKVWEVKQISWQILSVLMIIPLPIHLFPIAMIVQGRKAKIKSWYGLGIFFMLLEMVIFRLFVQAFGELSTTMLLLSIGSLTSYLIGNSILIKNIKPYLKRLELSEVHDLNWIGSIGKLQKWEQTALHSPQVFLTQLLNYRAKIQNLNVRKDIDKIIHLFRLLDEKDQMQAEKFVVRHNTVLKILGQYSELTQSKLENEVTNTSKKELEYVLQTAVVAIETEVTNQFKIEILDVNADTDVYIQQLKNRNLIR